MLADYPEESWLLVAATFLLGLLWKALKFVGKTVATSTLSYFLTERVLTRFYSSSSAAEDEPDPQRRVEDLSRELGHREGTESALRDQLDRERREVARLEDELREARRPRWRRFFGR